jgi:glycosyltransferase involved in cell wall biosynthesis
MTRILKVSLVTLGDPDTLTGGYLYHRRMAELAPSHAARLEFASFPDRAPFPLPALWAGKVLREVRRQAADVIVVDSIAAAYMAAVPRPPDLPMVAMLHQPPGGIDHGRVRRALQATLDRAAYRKVARLLVASDQLADVLAAEAFADQLTVVPPGRDVAPAATVAPRDLRDGSRAALLCVGNWVARKGILDLLEVVARLPEGLARLHLAGDEDAEPAYAARVRRRLAHADLAGRVVRHGRLPRGEIAALYRDADVFVLPSVREPYGTVYGEAMAAGLPVVGWRAGNLPYLARHGQEGLLVDPGDLDGLTSALATLARDEAQRLRLATAARRRAGDFPTWEQTAERFFASVRAAAGARTGARTGARHTVSGRWRRGEPGRKV